MKKPWRAGRFGKLLGLHSYSSHVYGGCWCQKNDRKYNTYQAMALGLFMLKAEANRLRLGVHPMLNKSMDDVGCSSCKTSYPHNHGRCCSSDCAVCDPVERAKP